MLSTFKNPFFLISVSFLFLGICHGETSIKRSEYLDINGKYLAEWEVDFDKEEIIFTVNVETTGFVGLGISLNPSMEGADIVIGGVFENKTTYFADYHATENQRPVLDESQDWTLLNATEANGHTILSFSRKLDTCSGEDDVAITADTQYLIWAFGDTDVIGYHDQEKRGPKIINLLDPSKPSVDLSEYEVFSIKRTTNLTGADTSYWCTIHKAPSFNGVKHHIVAFNTTLPDATSIKHTHHLVLHKCTAPTGTKPEDFFEQYVNHPGGECYTDRPEVPTEYCQSVLYIWAVGGEELLLPANTGYPIGDSGQQEYLMFELHIDNPSLEKNVTFETGIDIFYTSNIRKDDASVFGVGHTVNHFQTIPPKTSSYINVGHCSSECTKANVPETGMNLFNVMFHAHKAGRKMKARVFRDGAELPWLAVDNHYNFDYQANRPFREYVKILPGDHITLECTYDTTGRPNVTIGGHPTNYEMCIAFFWHYPKSFMYCDSSADPDLNKLFGIQNYTWNGESYEEPILTEPEAIRGMSYSGYLNTLNWTDQLKNDLQEELRYGRHQSRCLGTNIPVTYPQFDKEYEEIDACKEKNDDSGSKSTMAGNASMLLVSLINCVYFIRHLF